MNKFLFAKWADVLGPSLDICCSPLLHIIFPLSFMKFLCRYVLLDAEASLLFTDVAVTCLLDLSREDATRCVESEK